MGLILLKNIIQIVSQGKRSHISSAGKKSFEIPGYSAGMV